MSRETVIVVDDEPNTLDLCQRILRGDYEVLTALDGAEARQLVAGRDVAVALVDQRMPVVTGLEFLLGLAKTHPHTSRVAMTAFTELEVITALVNEGRVHGFVLKPWNNDQMRVIIDREVEMYRNHRLIAELNAKVQREHSDMLTLLRELDPSFEVPQSNEALKDAKNRLRQRVSNEVEKLFLENLLDQNGNISAAARHAQINRTFLYRLLKRRNPREA